MKIRIILAVIIALFAASCGEYEKLLKSSDYQLKKDKAIEYYEARKFVKATELFAQILPRYRASDEAEQLNWLNARAYYELRDYIMAGTYFTTFSGTYPFSRYAEEALFMAAYCDYKMSPKPELDQDNTRKAIEGMLLFKRRYPASNRIAEADMIIREMEENLVEKSYLSARLYYDMKQYRAAVVALNNSLNEYPDTKYREEMMYLKLNSQFLYAQFSFREKQMERYLEAYDDYLTYTEEYPEGTFQKEVKKIYDALSRVIKITDIGTENDKN
ncbi:MAG: outer membrane protein assembly factor BamD [Bacteroidetes bacterium]|nr:outer membrane protein assembly factor BamD [Bacteroidota bacterium]